jgi:hypothetical protein
VGSIITVAALGVIRGYEGTPDCATLDRHYRTKAVWRRVAAKWNLIPTPTVQHPAFPLDRRRRWNDALLPADSQSARRAREGSTSR